MYANSTLKRPAASLGHTSKRAAASSASSTSPSVLSDATRRIDSLRLQRFYQLLLQGAAPQCGHCSAAQATMICTTCPRLICTLCTHPEPPK